MISQPNENKTDFIVVVGMHRSGTSLVANILREAGFFVGRDEDLIRPDRWNEKGYFEKWDVYRLNEEILQDAGGSWFNPPQQMRILEQDRRDSIKHILSRFKDRGPSLIKDPRLCLTLPLWIPHLNGRVRIVWVLRSSRAVAASLQKRDGLPCWRGRELWRVYNQRAMLATRGLEVFNLAYEAFFDERREDTLAGLSRYLGIGSDLIQIAEHTIDARLNHHHNHNSDGFSPSALESLHEQSLAALKADRRNEAIRLLENLLQTEPDHALAHNDLGVLYFQDGKRGLALQHLQMAINLEPDNPGFAENLRLARRAFILGP